MKFTHFICIVLQLAFYSVISQEKVNSATHLAPQEIWEAGLPYIENYTSDVYKNSPWNFRIIQGNNGFMYIGNGEGILEFDSNSWDFIPVEHKNWITAFSKTDSEKIFVGGNEELGYLAPDRIGEMKYNSLIGFLEPSYKNFGNIWSTVTIGNDIYFSSLKYLFKWDGKKFKTWEAKEEFGKIFKVNNSLYINDQTVGLQKLVGDSLHVIPGADILVNNANRQSERVREMLPYQDNQILIIHSHQGLLIYNGESFEPFNEKSNAILLKRNVYEGITLTNGDYALATLTFGVYIINGKTGEIKKRLGKKHGLTSNEIYAIYEDRNGAIWVCGGEGISKIEWASPFRIFNNLSGLNEIVTSVCYQSGKLLAESNGLYYLAESDVNTENKEFIFKKTEGIRSGRIVNIISNQNNILACNESQVYKISNTYAAQLIAESGSNFSFFEKSKINDSKFYFATFEEELFDLTFIDNEWITRSLLKTDGVITSLVEKPDGNLWLTVQENGVYFAKKLSNDRTKYQIKKYDTLSGLPSMSNNYINQYQDNTILSTVDGYYKFNEINQTFKKYSLWQDQYNESLENLSGEFLDSQGGIWHSTVTDDVNKIFKVSENKLSEITEYKLFSDSRLDYLEVIDDIAVFVTTKGILMYNTNEARVFNKDLSTKLKRVWINNDSLIYAGSKSHKSGVDNFEVPFKNNTLKFEYTLPSYTKSQKNEYQYFLEGFEDNWSSWSTETKKDYTNIPVGNYTFKVRAKNIYDKIGREDVYSFTVLPPWQSTWWAYLMYAFGAMAVLSLIIKWRSKELQVKNERLENLVAERTTEIRHKNELLNHQTEQLEQLNNSKTRLYSNITHEFRTPLTVILGMTETLRTNVLDNRFESAEKSLEMIRRNSENLLRLVNDLLDLAKIESGSMELNLIQTDVIPFVKYMSESFHSLAQAKRINLVVYSEIDALQMDIDVNKMASIISNLLSNAIKFTETNGKIIVHLNRINLNKCDYLAIKIQDNGLGLAKSDMVHLFDRFYQVESVSSSREVGTGIGLSLTKEFVELMHGTITVDSLLGKGSTFMVHIPATNNAVKTQNTTINIEKPIENAATIKKTKPQLLDETSTLPLALIIEDNEDVAHYLKICLKEKYQTIHANNGTIGIEIASEKIPDIIISDVMMPGKDGFEVCATLKTNELTDHIPIILLTAKITTEDRLAGLSHGADAYLAKPFNEKELFIRLDQLILLRKKLIDKIQKDGLDQFFDKQPKSPETKFLQKVIQFIHEDISNSTFGSNNLASKLHLSESQIYRKLKAITNKSTAIFIRSIRLQKAKELIETTDKTISEIAYETGFNDPSWFSKTFKDEFGFAPSKYHK